MIVKIRGQLVEKKEHSVVLGVQGLYYEVMVPQSVLRRIEEAPDAPQEIELITYHYLQVSQSSAVPVLIGFLNEIECEFFQQFIKVSGIGPRAAVKAISKPISEITQAIHQGDTASLKTLPGIGLQRAKEIVAKLQDKVGKYGLIQDAALPEIPADAVPDWQNEALDVLLQLQYKRPEAQVMIQRALERNEKINSAQELLNEIYKQKVSG
ncbi:MAG: Holliday junction DNA helicase RuvA [Candidatus Omnitrophica bacterium]|nr:Holliday junction DNA helicase RuvA [Candidatus Omnitrophota bacterium]